MLGKVKFYIIVPVYNVENYIHACIQSVLQQTYQEYKVILVDDGSSDKSGIICDEYQNNNKNIVAIHQKNQGLFSARQSGIQYMLNDCLDKKNTFMISLDSDDTLKLNALEKIAESVLSKKCDMIVYGYDRVLDGNVIEKYNEREHFERIVTDKRELYKSTFIRGQYLPVWLKAVSVECVSGERKYKNETVTMGEDVVQSLDYYRNSERVFFLNEALYNYTVNQNSITGCNYGAYYKDDLRTLEIAFNFLENENVLSEEDWKEYRSYCKYHIAFVSVNICCMNETRSNIKTALRYLRESPFYKEQIETQAVDSKRVGLWKAVCYLFEHRLYDILYVVAKMYGLVILNSHITSMLKIINEKLRRKMDDT